MKVTGTLEEVMGKVFELYMGQDVSDYSVKRFLKKMNVFREEEILNLVEMLQKVKENE